ncbi:LytR family transcriptional regulator [Peribacillus asahii]|uniref:LytR family transcriptional regulator n=2 Tax=Peribacillus asahii TaxID=228899 RepID=A0A398BAN0_9BACI|nr:LytR family transcriptional regulator [Peribacillus asahii]RID84746.1 LytR family transcriptional regulator [Peribacillus asahii]
MNMFEQLPKSVKKTLRYIKQDVHSIEKLEAIQKILNIYINRRKEQLQKQKNL